MIYNYFTRCEECRTRRSSVDVVRESDRMDLSLEELALLRVDHESLVGTLNTALPRYQDFLEWDATQLFGKNISQHVRASTDDNDDNKGDSETLKSWREVKTELDPILTAPRSDPQSGLGSRSLSDVEEQMREVQHHVDTLFEIVVGLEEQLELTKRRNTSLEESLNDVRHQLLEAERQRQAGGR